MASKEPLAIVGMACRFPGGASDIHRFWSLLLNGVDAICNVPGARWDWRKYYHPNPQKPGRAYVNRGGFLREPIDEFDPMFFRISPREAESLDPQQRLLLEVVYEATENAGIPLVALEGRRTGVFVGGFCLDANHLQLSPLNREAIDSHTATSSSMAMLANRVSYIFDFQGPSVTVDTACSSSLVATHLACQSVWNGECDVAITAGTNVMLLAETPITMSKGKFLSPDGRCMTFDSRANGYVRGEGAGAVIVKRLSHALRDNDRILAHILATGINQDGRTSGITLPNGRAQAALMRQVYAEAGVLPADIDYIEAHGTGTQAGDVTEAAALNEVLSSGRPANHKVVVGSVKTNIGHLEAAAGIAGLIKATLVLEKKQIVPNLHFQGPNPGIDFQNNCLRVPVSCETLSSDSSRSPLAAINSFGYGGTNAHVLLQAAHTSTVDPVSTRPPLHDEVRGQERLVCLSANSDAAIKELARKYVNWLTDIAQRYSFDDIVYSMNCRRSHLDHRIVVRASSHLDLKSMLRAYLKEGVCPGVTTGVVDPGRIVFVYTGMGPQWWAMGRELLVREPVFAQKLRECDAILSEISGWSILDELIKEESSSRIKETCFAQCANLSIQLGLTEFWKSWGVVPSVVVGHSIGEVAAAHASGAISLREALLISFHRSRLQATQAGTGGMLAVGLSGQMCAQRLASLGVENRVSVAAINSPTSVTLAGESSVLQSLDEQFQVEGIFSRLLDVEVPYHSPQMEAIRLELLNCLAMIEPRATMIDMVSTVTGTLIDGRKLDNQYWWKNVRQPVSFAPAISELSAEGYRHFVEIGPHPVLQPSINQSVNQSGKQSYTIQSLNRKRFDERAVMLDSLAQLHTLGIKVDWQNGSSANCKLVDLPGYPWQKEKYWRESSSSRQERFGNDGPAWFYHHLPTAQSAWQVEISSSFFPYLQDHVVQSNVVFPGAAYVEAGLELNRKLTQRTSCAIENISFLAMLTVAEDRAQKIQLHYDERSRYFSIHSCQGGDNDRWTVHAQGKIIQQDLQRAMPTRSLDDLKRRCPDELSPEQQYEDLRMRGLQYGPAFRTIGKCSRNQSLFASGQAYQREVLAQLKLSEELTRQASDKMLLHPTLLDGAFQSLVALFDSQTAQATSYVPVEIDKLLFYAPAGTQCWAHCRILSAGSSVIEGEIDLIGNTGEVLVSLQGVKCRAIAGTFQKTSAADCRYQIDWEESSQGDTDGSVDLTQQSWLILGKPGDYDRWRLTFERAGIQHRFANIEKTDELSASLVQSPFSCFLYLWPSQNSCSTPHQHIAESIWPLHEIVRSTNKSDLLPIYITVLTEQSYRVLGSESGIDPMASSIHGLLPVISNEHQNVKTFLVDVDSNSQEDKILRAIVIKSAETTIATRNSKRYVKRIRRITDQPIEMPPRFVSTKDANVELQITKPGSLESLEFVRKDRRAPGPGEIEIEVYAASLNFKDLLKVYGQLADNVIKDTYFGNSLGMELSGVVTQVGEGVEQFKIGDEVAGPIRGSFCSYATVPTTYVIRRPKTLSFNQTPVYIGYLAAYRGLVHCAQLSAGEKILIHNATGGVGIAAIQIAKWKNAEIYATAGTKEKREFLKNQGIRHVYDSRSLLFAQEILRDTDGYGVDVVINAIAGEALYESFNLLAAYGRFIEIGKKDIGEDRGLPMRAFNRNLTFTAVDMDRMLCDRIPTVHQILSDISENFESGIFQPVPMAEFKASQAKEAFAFMAQSKHTGKVVLEFKDDRVPIKTTFANSGHIDSNGSYIVTGGTSGFGLHVGDWLARCGAGALYLVSRSGLHNEADRQLVESMRKHTKVLVRQVDVTDRHQVDGLLAEIRDSGQPLKGILHAAMVLDDCRFSDMTKENYDRVLAPKVSGAWNLHWASQDDPVEMFILFSSIASLVGNIGQTSYVVANSFLDGFAHYRRSLGLPATTINWGVLSQSGVVSRNASLGGALAVSGMHGMNNSDALAGLEMIVAAQPTQVGLFDADWSRISSALPSVGSSAAYRQLIQRSTSDGSRNPKYQELVDSLLLLPEEKRQAEVESRFLETMAAILKIPTSRIDARKSISDLGIDSLVAVELIVAIQRSMGIEMTTVDLLSAPTVSDLAASALKGLISQEDEILAKLDEMSEEELDRLIQDSGDLVSSDK